ncbi:hypothetical protein H0H92_009291 [Tricholoma furcatifolium]|nr:hypothetical protein H0H92_009291 [Tricholoma furcatifolium]
MAPDVRARLASVPLSSCAEYKTLLGLGAYNPSDQCAKGHGSIFALWLLFNSLYAIYASAWDFLMDWSVLRVRSRYPLLRQELIYDHSIPMYYFAIITNIMLRFIWVIYIPSAAGTPNMYLRTFIGGLLEVLRRWQWNFYRLENEHLGNMDQYRVTHEVPLPYSFDHPHTDDVDDGDDEDDKALANQISVKRVKEKRRPGFGRSRTKVQGQ